MAAIAGSDTRLCALNLLITAVYHHFVVVVVFAVDKTLQATSALYQTIFYCNLVLSFVPFLFPYQYSTLPSNLAFSHFF